MLHYLYINTRSMLLVHSGLDYPFLYTNTRKYTDTLLSQALITIYFFNVVGEDRNSSSSAELNWADLVNFILTKILIIQLPWALESGQGVRQLSQLKQTVRWWLNFLDFRYLTYFKELYRDKGLVKLEKLNTKFSDSFPYWGCRL